MCVCTPNLPTNIIPTNIARVKLSREIPRKSLWAWEFHPLQLRLCSSQTLGRKSTMLVGGLAVRPIFILRILRPRIFESKFRDHCAKKLEGALRKSTSFV